MTRRPPAWLLLGGAFPTLLVAMPVGYVAFRGWQAGPAAVVADIARPYTLNLLLNTLTLATAVTLAAALLGTLAAWCTERTDLAGARAWRLALSLPLAMPAYVSSFAWSSLGPALQGMGGAIFILTLYSLPLVYLPLCAALRSLDPALEDVARSLGHSRARTFRRVTLPQLAPALGASALLVTTHMLAEFGALVFLRVETFTTAIFDQYTGQFDNQTAALLAGVLMILALPVAFGESTLRARRHVARIGRGAAAPAATIRLGPWHLPAQALLATLVLLGIGVPLATLGVWLLRGTSAGQGIGAVLPAMLSSLHYALPGAALTVVLAIPLVAATLLARGRLATLADRLPFLVHGLPGIVIALAAVAISVRVVPAIYQTTLLVMLAYAVLSLPLAQSSIRASAALLPPGLSDIARSLGKPPFRAFALAVLPNLAPGIGAALALGILSLMRELTATLLLAPAGSATLATEFWNYTADRAYAAAAPFAAALVLVCGVPVYTFTMRTLRLAPR